MFTIVQLDKISTLSRKDRKEKCRSDGLSVRSRNIEDVARDEQQMLKFQQTISRLSDSDVNARFEQMLVSIVPCYPTINSYGPNYYKHLAVVYRRNKSVVKFLSDITYFKM